MAGVSKVTIIGNLGRDPETRYTPSGTMNVQFSVAVSRRWTDQGGQPQEKTTWFRVTAWTRLAETLDRLTQDGILVKGRQVYVSGTLETSEFTDRNNQPRMSLDVRADEVLLTGNRGDSEGGPGSSGGGTPRGGGGSRFSGEDSGSSSADIDEVPF